MTHPTYRTTTTQSRDPSFVDGKHFDDNDKRRALLVDICVAFTAHSRSLYEPTSLDRQTSSSSFLGEATLPTVSLQAKEELNAAIMEQEVREPLEEL
ncbi:hypothetical protein NDU88_004906 [Pleurodeles waltl]|uniref:Uncharacterized protein n=1 Tax=Pleurodeles waltl TaxID=8319 RepID=A0AAV7TVR0_PLEWA|nr:hypothetical protein NDU88_004906 [Pleurodeles waltl]